jgi:[acyl-carrier-protein] S-malonyltransferase
MRRLAAEGATVFVEVGPGSVLSGLGRKVVPDGTFMRIDRPEHLEDIVALVAARRSMQS